jgi:hypothetical protein
VLFSRIDWLHITGFQGRITFYMINIHFNNLHTERFLFLCTTLISVTLVLSSNTLDRNWTSTGKRCPSVLNTYLLKCLFT